MPELVTCPACGCKVQVAEMFLGQRLRCIACARVFQASLDPIRPTPVPWAAPAASPRPAGQQGSGQPRPGLPLCPGCHHPVGWEVLDCPHCGHLLDPLDAFGRGDWVRRRDADAHRGRLIDNLGTLSLFGGALSLCTGPIGFCAALCTGIPAVLMARHDLERMRIGAVDPEGRALTEFGRNKANVGLILALLFGLFFFVLIFMDLTRAAPF